MKEFEKEYRQMIQEEMPDLWGRIEAGLKDRASDGTTGKRKIVSVKWRRYMGVAAACLCGAIVIPAVAVLLRAGSFGIRDSGSSTDSASPAAMNAETADMAMEEYSEAVAAEAEESVMDAAGNQEAAASADMAENMENISGAGGIENGDGGGADGNGMLTDHETTSAGNSATESSDMPDQTMIENVRVKILEVSRMQYHKIYLVMVVQDDSGWLAEGEEMHFLSGLEDEMEEGAEYQVSLVYHEGAEVPFRLLE